MHIKADVFLRDGQQLRFCQRCGHAHTLDGEAGCGVCCDALPEASGL